MAFELKDYSFEAVLQRLVTKLEEDSSLSGIGKFLYFSVMNVILRIVAWAVSFLAEYDNEIFQELHLVTCTNYEHGRVKAKGLNYTPSRRKSATGTVIIATDDTLVNNPEVDFNIAKWTPFTIGGKKYLIYSDSFTLSTLPSENLVRSFDDDTLVPTEILSESLPFEIARYSDATILEELQVNWGKQDFTFELFRYKTNNHISVNTGTIAVTLNQKQILGTGTSFLTDFEVGDGIVISDIIYIISSITDDSTLEITVPYPNITSPTISNYSKLISADINEIIQEGSYNAVKDFPYVGKETSNTVAINDGTNLLTSTGNDFTDKTEQVLIYISPTEYYVVDVDSYISPTQVTLTENWSNGNISGNDFMILVTEDEFYSNIDFEEVSYADNYTGITSGDILPVDKKYEEVNFGTGSGIKLVVTDGNGVPIHNGNSDTNETPATLLGTNVLTNPTAVAGESFIVKKNGTTLSTYVFPTASKTPSEIVNDLNAHFGGDLLFSLSSGKVKVEHSDDGSTGYIECTTSPVYLAIPTGSVVYGTELIAEGGLLQTAPYVLSDAYELNTSSDILECITDANSLVLDSTGSQVAEPYNSHKKYLAVPVEKEVISERVIVDNLGNVLDTSNEIVSSPYDHRNVDESVKLIMELFNENILCVRDSDTTAPLDKNDNHLVSPFDYTDYYNAKRIMVFTENYNVPSDGAGIPQKILRDQDGDYIYDGLGAIIVEPLNIPYDEQELYTTDILTYKYYKNADVIQGERKEVFYNSTGEINENIIIENDSVENDNLLIEVAFSKDVNGDPVWEEYTEVSSFYNSSDTDNHYILEPFDFMQKLKVTFPDGIKGKKLPSPSELIPTNNIRVSFVETQYTNSEITSVGLIGQFDDANLNELYLTNSSVLVGATDNETLEGIQENAPKVFQKGDNAIDYEGWAIAVKRFGGIQEVSVIGELDTLVTGENANIEMANFVKIFIVPESGIILDDVFFDNLGSYLLSEKAITDIPLFEQIKYVNVLFKIDNIVKGNTSIDDFEIEQKSYISQTYKLSERVIGEDIINSEVIRQLKNDSSQLVDVDVVMQIEQVIDVDTSTEYKTHVADVDVIDIEIEYEDATVPQPTLILNSTEDFPTGSLVSSSNLFSAFNFNFLTGELNFNLKASKTITAMKFTYNQKDVGTNTGNITIDSTMIAQYKDAEINTVFEDK